MNKTVTALLAVVVVVAIAIGVSASHNNNKKSTNSTNTASSTAPPKEDVVITGAGSTFAAPLYDQLGSTYKTATGSASPRRAQAQGMALSPRLSAESY